MEGKAIITLESHEDGQVSLTTVFIPDMKFTPDAVNPPSHRIAMQMLETAIFMSEDPQKAMREAEFGPGEVEPA